MTVICKLKRWYSSDNFFLRYKILNILKKSLKSCGKNEIKVDVDKMKIKKTYFVLFSNARFILELMLSNQNLTKLVYPTLLSLNCSA